VNAYLVVAAALAIVHGLVHSALGEAAILAPLFARGNLPPLLGSELHARQTLRLAWHVTTVLLWGIAALMLVLASRPLDATALLVVRVLAVSFAGAAVVAAVGSRLWHFAWGAFAAIAVLLWLGTR
jgi:hypothetical protein